MFSSLVLKQPVCQVFCGFNNFYFARYALQQINIIAKVDQ
jgi:hypothetical protein